MLLGFSTCDSEPGAAMYGTPHADFTIKGKVVNQENMPIPDIEIKCLVEHHGDNRHWFDTIPAVSTDPAGVFHCQFEEFPTDKLHTKKTLRTLHFPAMIIRETQEVGLKALSKKK